MMQDYATGRAIENVPGRVYVRAVCYRGDVQVGAATTGWMDLRHVPAFVSSLSDLLEEVPETWPADRIVVTVGQ